VDDIFSAYWQKGRQMNRPAGTSRLGQLDGVSLRALIDQRAAETPDAVWLIDPASEPIRKSPTPTCTSGPTRLRPPSAHAALRRAARWPTP
jgi:hypothetical protein